jgi:hypothetical protein
MLEIVIDNRDGNVWELPGANVTYKTSRMGRASSVDITFLKGGWYESSEFKYNNGDVVRVQKDGIPVFYGYIFNIDDGRDEDVKITAYDQIRYLMANDTYVFKNASVAAVIQRIAHDFNLKVGTLADPGYKIPAMVEDGSKLLDIICKALDKTLIATGKNYVFYDDFGELALRDVTDWKLDLSLGDVSLAYDYKQKRSIDSDTYNRVKIVQDNKKTGHRDVYIAQDSSNISKWGRLQLYQKADEKMNAAQINESLNNLLALKNRETRTFSIEAIGDLRVRAGCSVSVNIEELGVNNHILVDDCSHKFDGDDHTMTLELKVFG